MEWTRESLAAQFKEAREEAGSQFQVAQLVGVTPQMVAKYEKGQVIPGPSRALKLAEFMKVDYAPLKEFLMRMNGDLEEDEQIVVGGQGKEEGQIQGGLAVTSEQFEAFVQSLNEEEAERVFGSLSEENKMRIARNVIMPLNWGNTSMEFPGRHLVEAKIA